MNRVLGRLKPDLQDIIQAELSSTIDASRVYVNIAMAAMKRSKKFFRIREGFQARLLSSFPEAFDERDPTDPNSPQRN